ncbi:unnamed protein product, partial [Rotaria magnacalcarata]
MDQQLFYRCFDQIFLKHTKDLPRPLLLILDGHGSHFNVETLKLACENNVIIVCLPSNATHVLQPLDIVFFNPFKIQWKKILKDEYSRTNFKNVGKPEFPSLLNQLWTNDPVGTKTNIIKSFMKAGVFPFNPNSIDRSRILKSKVDIDKNQSTVPTDTANNNNKVSRVQQSTTQAINNSFATSHQAIASLNRILEDTKSIGSSDEDPHDQTEDDDDNDDDDEYLPSKSNFHSPTSSSSNSQNDENTSLSTSKSPKTSQTKHQPQTTQNSSSKHLEKILQERKIKRLKSTVTAVDLETSQEDAPDTSTSNPPNSIQAITTAIQAIFVIDGSNGQVITEKIVIQQLEERKKQQNLKRPKSNNRTSQPKRQK